MDEKGKEENSLIIMPKKGLTIDNHQLLFGDSQEDIVKIIGKADKIYKTDEENIRWQYYDFLIELSFERENSYTLGWIEVYNKKATIFNQNIIGNNKKNILKLFNNNLSKEFENEDYGSFETTFYTKDWIELQFQFNLLHNINFGS